MMKKLSATLLLISIFVAFAIFVTIKSKSYTVMAVDTPTKLTIKADINKKSTKTENICIEGVETFSLEVDNDKTTKYERLFNLTKEDTISLGYLAQEFAQKALLNQKVTIKYGPKVTKDCKYANIYIYGYSYKKTLQNSGFGIVNDELCNIKKFNENLKKAKNLNLVILNHHSGKYHSLACPYGVIAHDKVILPKNQLPEDSTPCKFCNKQSTKTSLEINKDIFDISNIIQPKLALNHNSITTIMTDYTQNLKPNNKCSNLACTELINRIDNANSSIDIAIYGYRKIPEITEALKRAKKRGVNIRFIYDSYFDVSKNYYQDNQIIENISNEFRSDKTNSDVISNMLMHNKFIIFDKKTVYTGSMNISSSGVSGYDVNSIIIIESPEIASVFTKEFEQMMSGKFHTDKVKVTNNQKYILNDSEVEVYFSPKDDTTTRIIELINCANSYIYIPTFLITHSGMSEALIDAKKRGVDVRIIIDANSVSTRGTKHAKLRNAGIMLKTENYAGKMHSKAMIIDDQYFITGSMNFSYSGANKNDENTIIIKDKKIAEFHKNIFLYLWTKIPNRYLNKNAKPESPDSIGSCVDGVDNNFNNKTDKEESYCNI